MKTASIGSISHGTLRDEDLFEAFGNELEWQIQRNGEHFSKPENFQDRDRLNALHGDYLDAYEEDGETIKWDVDASELIDSLSEALNEFAPPYCYFGAHYGDRSDFGFWPSHDAIDELPTVEGSDQAKELGEDCKSVNDHGNVTVYGGDGSIVLELV